MTNGYVNLPKGLIDKIVTAIITNTETLNFIDEHLAIDLYNCLNSGKPAVALYSGSIGQQSARISLPFSYFISDTSISATLFGTLYVGRIAQVGITMDGDTFSIAIAYTE